MNFRLFSFFLLAYVFAHCNAKPAPESKSVSSGVLITEFMAKSDSDDEMTVDWIELYNSSSSKVDLSNWSLSDGKKKIGRYNLSGIELEPDEYAIIYADGNESLAGHVDFRLDASGGKIYLTNSNNERIQSIKYPVQLQNISYVLVDGEWNYCNAPTPKAKNSESGIFTHRSEEVSVRYISDNEQVYAELSSESKDKIYYTLDEAKPSDEGALKYSGKIKVEEGLLIRAVVRGSNTLVNDIFNSTYINPDNYGLPVVSLLTDPDNLFDEKIGILAGTNWGYKTDDWIREGRVEVFKENEIHQEEVDFKVFGNASRTKAKKSMAILAKGKMPNYFFSDLKSEKIDGFIVRACHNGMTKYRNEFVNDVNKELGSKMIMQQYVPSVLFLNGKYWGVYNIMERKNAGFIKNHFGFPATDMINLNKSQAKIQKGDNASFNQFISELNAPSLTEKEIFDLLDANFDMDNLVDFWAQEFILNRVDTYNNRLWKHKTKSDKWSFISFDYDICLGKSNSMSLFAEYLVPNEAAGLTFFNRAFESNQFKTLLFKRMCDFMNFGYTEERISRILVDYENLTSEEFARDTARWNMQNGNSFVRDIDGIARNYNRFFTQRKEFIRSTIIPNHGFTEKVIFQIPDSTGYHIYINGYLASGEIIYFTGMDLSIKVKGDKPVWLANGKEFKMEENMNFNKAVTLVVE